ncbi:hypothetical protein L227DRAFT_580916 [Lentinus tigrinus ALCF2SS1-6]|uniref:Uncharacterized protein n=1 Tax=Lentinus tigrinus ALCF2SS1-6 TaxID=1328759 RepID=A0A5C2RQV0_9APHY|nr:hypothetical protein L227DRAFT_580916 [Lentinus tigrinus ALCF2SS1-6]
MSNERQVERLASYYLQYVGQYLTDNHKKICDEALKSGIHVDLARLARWRLEGGIVMTPESVPNVLVDDHGRLYQAKKPIDRHLKKHIFAYAALSVVDHPMHSAHCAFWVKHSIEDTAALVVKASYSNKVPIQFKDKQDLVERVKAGQRRYEGRMVTEGLERVQKWMAEHVQRVGRNQTAQPAGPPPTEPSGHESSGPSASVTVTVREREEQIQRIKRWQEVVRSYDDRP